MHVALVVVGALLGLAFGSGTGTFFFVLMGGVSGYVLAELRELRVRGDRLEKEVSGLAERLAAAQRGAASDAARVGPISQASAATQASDAFTASVSRGSGPTESPPPSPLRSIGAATSAASDAGAIWRYVRDFFTGGNTVVRVGILILFFGVAFLLRYLSEHTHVPIQFRLSGVACGGIALLILGWRLRRRRLGYALALQGGGVGILYLTAFAALRLYSLLPPTVAFAIFVVLAAFSAALAVLQDSQAFALLAVTGGFLAPILASTGEGSHVVLFSYYAILNASILVIAWYKSWRPLNLAGFLFTFIISTTWGVLHYNSHLFASTEPFLLLFFALYVAIAILFSIRQPPQLRGYVDGTLVFGTPMAAFGYQSAMLHDRPLALASSALVAAAVYITLAWGLHRQHRSFQRLLVEAYIALGVVFLTVAVPLALDSGATGAAWALEAAALVWIGARQSRVLPRVLGLILQIVAGLLLWSTVELHGGDRPSSFAWLPRALVAVAAVFSAVVLRKYAERLRPYEAVSGPVLFFFGLGGWLIDGLQEIERHVPYPYERSVSLAFVAATAVASSELSRRTVLSLARLPALWLLPALVFFAADALVGGVTHPAFGGGWLAWPLAFAAVYVMCRRHEAESAAVVVAWLHTIAAWLLVALLTWEVFWAIDYRIGGKGSWSAAGLMLISACVLYALPRLTERVAWPLKTHRRTYLVFVGGGLAIYLAAWSIGTNLALTADPYPFPYVPLLNALDLAQLLALLVLWHYWRYVRSLGYYTDVDMNERGPKVFLAALAFVWLNAGLLRTLHHWAGVPFDFDAMMQSTLVETALSIFWTVLALATMLLATRRPSRGMWVSGAVLLAVTILKLFVVDLSRGGTIERIVSFVAVGLLTLVIGYFSPLPPAAREPRTSAT